MPELIAIAIGVGPRFVTELTRAWEGGDAVLPVDPRLPVPAAQALLRAMRPAVLVDETGEHHRLAGAAPVEVGDALVVVTSGTTGEPKGVVLTHDAVAASALATSAALRVDPGRDAWLAVLPVAHIGGLAVVTRALVTGTPLTFDADDPSATLVSLVPTQVERLERLGPGGLDRFRAVLVGGSADWRAADRPANVVHTYGMTETGSGVVYDGVPLAGVDVRVVDGEVQLRGPMLLRCYRDGTDPRDAAGWLATGDGGEFDRDGRLTVHGRMAEVIVTGGEKVWPAAVEAVLAGVPGVGEVAVAGRADPEWGERVVAFVVPVDSASPPALDELREAVKQTLPAYAAPREIVTVDALPRTDGGKIRRGKLTEGR